MAKPIDNIVGISRQIQGIRDLISRVADSNTTTLISGESGTGKTLIAMTIHQMSRRANESLLQFDCAATPDESMETELFGNEVSDRVKKGLFDASKGRTVLLQNVDQIPLQLQAKLLRVFQDREFQRRGGSKYLPTDCRFIATCTGDIQEKVRANLFREDLYYRLNVVLIHLPPLRERLEDIRPLLVALATRLGANADQFIGVLQNQALIGYLEKYSWPGNVRELQRIVEMVIVTKRWDEIKRHLLGHGGHSSRMVIERYIEFPPEYHQAGISILSFFGEVLRRKYPDNQATVRIVQDGLRVKMVVEPFIGEPEIFQRALDQYGLVVTGQITPEEFTSDPLLVVSLKHELRMAQARIESQKELLQVYERNDGRKDSQISKLTEFLEKAFSPTQPNPVNITFSPVITSSVNVPLGISNAIGDI